MASRTSTNEARNARRALLGAVLSGFLALPGCSQSETPDASLPVASAAHPGAPLYERYCALCHGADGRGYRADNAPAIVGPELLRTASDSYLTTAIAQGRPGTTMSAWERRRGGPLEPAQIRTIVRYLRTFQHQPPIVVRDVDVNGEPARGAIVYGRECARCHGWHGEGNDAVQLRNPVFLATASDGFIQYAVIHGRSGTRMPAFATQLSRQQIDDVVTFVRALSKDSGPVPPPPQETPHLPALTELQIVLHPRGPRPRFNLREDRYVPAAEVERELQRGARMIVLDARPTSDWLTGHVPGAVPVPYYELDAILEALPRDGTFMIAYCGCPHAASGHVVDALRAHEFRNTAVMDEGIHFWEEQGYPTEHGAPQAH
jgi:mono/diheme cytochrome c family protein/rhodanese-related sulfurtransferase